jgi:hypothetical protein
MPNLILRVTTNDEPLLGHDLPFQPSLPHCPLRKGHGFSGDRCRHVQQAGRPGGINPHNRVPVLVERDLVLFEPNIINEYIDERFPHPQLMPADPIMRARARQLLVGMEREIFSFMEVIEKNSKTADKARQEIRARLTEIIPIFNKQKVHAG